MALLQLSNCWKIVKDGSVGSKGPKGGRVNTHSPVREAAAYVANAITPTAPGTTKQLHQVKAPVKVSSYPKNDNRGL